MTWNIWCQIAPNALHICHQNLYLHWLKRKHQDHLKSFQLIYLAIFEGHHYLIYVDHFSGWPNWTMILESLRDFERIVVHSSDQSSYNGVKTIRLSMNYQDRSIINQKAMQKMLVKYMKYLLGKRKRHRPPFIEWVLLSFLSVTNYFHMSFYVNFDNQL